MKSRLDQKVMKLGLVQSRSQAESYIKLGQVKVNSLIIKKPGHQVSENDKIEVTAQNQYVSRAALKLASVTEVLKLNFGGKTVLDVGSSTGGFTDYALKHGAKKVIAVEVGTNQLHPVLQGDPRIELHEKTDIRDFKTSEKINLVVADVSFISLREILPAVAR
ncbi:MAG TPA: SAM-dependent methyltransferase, partial [Methylomirabilota bacterium]|nr:SAM-dependent methyltransferase [Methylomirabilota bacterium]